MIALIRRWLRRRHAPKWVGEPLPYGTVLIDGKFPVCADGKGGITVLTR